MSTKEQYWKYSLIAIIIILGLILFREMVPFTGGLLGAFTLYVLFRGQMLRLTEKRGWNKSAVSLLILFEIILLVLIPLYFIGWLLLSKLQNINLDPQMFVQSTQHIADFIQDKTGYNIFQFENFSSAASWIQKFIQQLMGGVSSFAINIFVLIFVLYFMLIGGRSMEKYIYDIFPFNDNNKKTVFHDIHLIVRSNAIGIPLLAIIQGSIAMLGYYLFGVPNAFLFGFLTCFATIIPMIGTGIVWFPLVIYLILTGDWPNALGLAAYALIIITNIDNLIRFMIQKKMANIHPLITIFGVIIGLSLFGFMGIIFGPLILSLFLLFVNMFKVEYLDKEDNP